MVWCWKAYKPLHEPVMTKIHKIVGAQISLRKYDMSTTIPISTKPRVYSVGCVLHSNDISNVRLCDEFLQNNNHIYTQFHILGKIFTGPTYSYFWALQSFQMFTGPLFQIKIPFLGIALPSGFQSFLGGFKCTEYNIRQYLANFMGLAGIVKSISSIRRVNNTAQNISRLSKSLHWITVSENTANRTKNLN